MGTYEKKQNVNKIKELLKSEDDLVSNGLKLARSLALPSLYAELLEGCIVNEKGQLINEKLDFNNYVFMLSFN